MWFRRGNKGALREEIDSLIHNSRKFRCRVRSGMLVLVTDRDHQTCETLAKLAGECNETIEVVKATTCKKAREVIENIGPESVKAVIIDAEMLDDNANGGSLPHWLGERHSQVPVWVYDCNDKKQKVVHRCSVTAGVIKKGQSLLDNIDKIGFPAHCKKA